MGMAMFKRTFAQTIPDSLKAPHMNMWGFEAKRARKFTRKSGVDKKGGFPKGWFWRMFPGTKTGTRVHSPKPPFYETALLSPSDKDPKAL